MIMIFILAVCVAVFTVFQYAKREFDIKYHSVKMLSLNSVCDIITVQDENGKFLSKSDLFCGDYYADKDGIIYVGLKIDPKTRLPVVVLTRCKAFWLKDKTPYDGKMKYYTSRAQEIKVMIF